MKDKLVLLEEVLGKAYTTAENLVEKEQGINDANVNYLKASIDLAKLKHAFRGAAVTLLGYKIVDPGQDVRSHKSEQKDGFSARTFDNKVTVPFLIEKSLPRSVETHWLTQTLSFAGTLTPDVSLKTNPKKSGPLLVEVVNFAQKLSSVEIENMLVAIFIELIKIRNQDKVILTRPKNLPIDTVKSLLDKHFKKKYKNNAPRLPQLAIYAIYRSMIGKISRFDGQSLDILQRMKAADRKSGTVGDIVVLGSEGNPTEAVEIKFGQPITYNHVCEAIDKVRAESVSRYYMLSTEGISKEEQDEISTIKDQFLKQNGCEIIVNGVIETVGYYLRLLPNTTEFLSNYAVLVEGDEDTAYEHRISWNESCKEL